MTNTFTRMAAEFNTETPTNRLRWNRGTLEQEWEILRTLDGIVQSADTEWRTVEEIE